MKKTLSILLAASSFCLAETEALQTFDLTSYNISFEKSSTLTSGNAAMKWQDGAEYINWYITLTLTDVTTSDYYATVTAGNYNNGSSTGLSVSTKKTTQDNIDTLTLTFGKGGSAVYDETLFLNWAPLKTQKGKRPACKCLRQDFLKPEMRLKWRMFWFYKTHLGTVHP